MKRMKKALSLLTCVAMTAGMIAVPNTALAAEGDVAKVEDINGNITGYSSLSDAVSNAKDGDTITLQSDATGSYIDTSNKNNITINLGGHTYTSNYWECIENYGGNEITIKNGTLDSVDQEDNAIYNTGTIIADKLTIRAGWNGISNYGELKITNSIVNGDQRGIWSSGPLTVNNCDITGTYQAICTTGGKCEINGGTYKSTATAEGDNPSNAVLVAPWNDQVSLEINGGTFETGYKNAIYCEVDSYINEDGDQITPYDHSITISNATIKGGIDCNIASNDAYVNVTSIEHTTIDATSADCELYNNMDHILDSEITGNIKVNSIKSCTDTSVSGELRVEKANGDVYDNINVGTLYFESGGDAETSATIKNENSVITTLQAYQNSVKVKIEDGIIHNINTEQSTGRYEIIGGQFGVNPKDTIDPKLLTLDSLAFFLQNPETGLYEFATTTAGKGFLTVKRGSEMFVSSTLADGEYDNGTAVTVTAFNNPFYPFKGWYLNNAAEPISTENKFSTVVSGNMTLEAKYSEGIAYTQYDYDSIQNFKVSTEADLFGISYLGYMGKDFKGKTITLMDDITMTQNFFPICAAYLDRFNYESKVRFQGTFDGNNHSISNFTCDYPDQKSDITTVGLIGLARDAAVKNLTVNVKRIMGIGQTAVLVAWADANVTVEKCIINGEEIGEDDVHIECIQDGYTACVFGHEGSGIVRDTTIQNMKKEKTGKTGARGAVAGNAYSLKLERVNIINTDFTSLVSHEGYGVGSTKIEMNDCTTSQTKGELTVISSDATVVIGGNDTNLDVSSIISNGSGSVTITGGTYTTDVKPYLADGLAVQLANKTDAEGNDTYTVVSPSTVSGGNVEIATKVKDGKYDQLKSLTKTYSENQTVTTDTELIKLNIMSISNGTEVFNRSFTGKPETETTITGGTVAFNLIVKNVPEDVVLTITQVVE